MKRIIMGLILFCGYWINGHARAGIHSIPIVLTATQIRAAQYYPVKSYRVFRTGPDGTAIPIPFQIDQKDKFDDYALDLGKHPNPQNRAFGWHDELCLMGDDVGVKKFPKKWPFKRPEVLYEIEFKKTDVQEKNGAIYLGIYFKDPPPLAKETYVQFDIEQEQVLTAKYRYLFNTKNYLVVRGVNIEEPQKKEEQIILSSAVYMKLDMKYFLTLNLGHSDIESELDAYKIGPIRVIARVNFDYKVLKMKFDLGMYTEVSFFSNSVNLPAIIDNPMDGKKSLNRGSYFYYGLALVDNPKDLQPKSNMPDFKGKGGYVKVEGSATDVGTQYWASAESSRYMLYLEFMPSKQMEKDENIPSLFVEHVDKEELLKRESGPLPLGDSPVNVAVAFSLRDFARGLHQVQFRVFIENIKSPTILDEFKDVSKWKITSLPVKPQEY
jgi:hypothetical protein